MRSRDTKEENYGCPPPQHHAFATLVTHAEVFPGLRLPSLYDNGSYWKYIYVSAANGIVEHPPSCQSLPSHCDARNVYSWHD